MAITQERITKLLAAAEDALGAVRQAGQVVRESCARVRDGTSTAERELDTIEALVDPERLMQSPILTILAIEREKEHWSETRVNRNNRKRAERAHSMEADEGE